MKSPSLHYAKRQASFVIAVDQSNDKADLTTLRRAAMQNVLRGAKLRRIERMSTSQSATDDPVLGKLLTLFAAWHLRVSSFGMTC